MLIRPFQNTIELVDSVRAGTVRVGDRPVDERRAGRWPGRRVAPSWRRAAPGGRSAGSWSGSARARRRRARRPRAPPGTNPRGGRLTQLPLTCTQLPLTSTLLPLTSTRGGSCVCTRSQVKPSSADTATSRRVRVLRRW
eukprot:6116771-Pyramimonas_sp.AAC.1